jgi:hypothetical protein
MFFQPLFQTNRAPDLEIAGSKAQEIGKRQTPRKEY